MWEKESVYYRPIEYASDSCVLEAVCDVISHGVIKSKHDYCTW